MQCRVYHNPFAMKDIRVLRCFIMAVIVIALVEPAVGQRWKLRRYEVGGGIGMTQVFGDIGGTIDQNNWFGLKDIKIDETRMAFPLYVRYRLDPVYCIRVNGLVGFGNGTDADSRNDRGRSYKTMLTELSVQGEYYFIAEERRFRSAAMFNRRGMLNNYMSFNAYGFAGIGGLYAHAREIIVPDPAPYDVIKRNTVGVVIPFGVGLKYIIDDRLLLNAELGYRFPFMDYIEGYQQTQDSKHNDIYYILNVTLGYRLKTSRKGIPEIFDREYRGIRHAHKAGANKPRSKREALE
jgi:hypothetical protein